MIKRDGSKASMIASPLLVSVKAPPGTRIASSRSLSCVIQSRPERQRAMGLRAKASKKYKATTDSGHGLPIAPNLLGQDFSCDASAQSDFHSQSARPGMAIGPYLSQGLEDAFLKHLRDSAAQPDSPDRQELASRAVAARETGAYSKIRIIRAILRFLLCEGPQ
jgi:hypothetical protein